MSVCSLSLCACASAFAQQGQWTVTNLHPAGATRSSAAAVDQSGQVGSASINGKNQAILWRGSAASFVNLTPTSGREAWALGVSDGTQVGVVVVSDGEAHAAMWKGSADGWIDLNPAGAYSSSATCASGTRQGGSWNDVVGPHACLWSGSPESVSDLTLSGDHVFGNVNGIDAQQQVGRAYSSANGHPAMWQGTPASMIYLDPEPVSDIISGIAAGVHGGQQVGYLYVQSAQAVHASLWSSQPNSWVDLHPGSRYDSQALGVYSGRQVGFVRGYGWSQQEWHASIWSGTAASWIDLHQYLPAGFSSSYAYAIWSDTSGIQVVGQGFNGATSRYEALLWTYAFAVCAGDFNADGFLDFTDFDAFVSAFESGAAAADVNGDGFLDSSDFDAFVLAFETGC